MFFDKKNVSSERNPINLPFLSEDDLKIRNIAKILQKGGYLVVWRCFMDVKDWFEVYKAEDGLIFKYIWDFSNLNHQILRLENLRLTETDCFIDLWEETFSKAKRIYVDEEKRMEEVDIAKTTIDFSKLKKKLHKNEIYQLKETDYKKIRD